MASAMGQLIDVSVISLGMKLNEQSGYLPLTLPLWLKVKTSLVL